VGKIAWHRLTAWAISAFTRVFDALWAPGAIFAHAVGIGEGAVAHPGEETTAMARQKFLAAVAAAAVLAATLSAAQAFDETKYPNLKGQWTRFVVPGLGGQPSFDQTKPWAFGQEAPLTPEYKSILEKSIADQATGGQGNFTGYGCLAYGMPMMMTAFYPQEYVITPETTYIVMYHVDGGRRIFTDGRDWARDLEPTYVGYSIGRWLDEDGDGRYDVLEVETRGPFKGPRVYDGSGLPLHYDNQSIFKERIYVDKSNPNLLHDEITVIDHALTRPWTVDKRYRRNTSRQPVWPEYVCAENNVQVRIGDEYYYLSAGHLLMPTRKDQQPPDLRYFQHSTK
jgi:hypothetical protein